MVTVSRRNGERCSSARFLQSSRSSWSRPASCRTTRIPQKSGRGEDDLERRANRGVDVVLLSIHGHRNVTEDLALLRDDGVVHDGRLNLGEVVDC